MAPSWRPGAQTPRTGIGPRAPNDAAQRHFPRVGCSPSMWPLEFYHRFTQAAVTSVIWQGITLRERRQPASRVPRLPKLPGFAPKPTLSLYPACVGSHRGVDYHNGEAWHHDRGPTRGVHPMDAGVPLGALRRREACAFSPAGLISEARYTRGRAINCNHTIASVQGVAAHLVAKSAGHIPGPGPHAARWEARAIWGIYGWVGSRQPSRNRCPSPPNSSWPTPCPQGRVADPNSPGT